MLATSLAFVAIIAAGAPAGVPAGAPSGPAEGALEDTWNLADVYATNESWETTRRRLESRYESLARFRGRLGESASVLAAALENSFDVQRDLMRVYAYASMLSDQDTREAGSREMDQQGNRLLGRFAEACAFLEPEILALGRAKVEAFLASEPRLEPYRHTLDDILRRAPHTLDTEGEELVAATIAISDAASSLYNILSNADIQWPKVKLASGEEVTLNQAAYSRYRGVSNRADRKKVFQAFWSTWKSYERTMGVALYSQIKRDWFYAQVRNYPTSVAAALGDNNVPEAVYKQLVAATNANLDTLQRYLALRARMLGITDLRYHDLYPPLVSSGKRFPIAEGKRLVLEAVAPLGEEYVAGMRKGLDNRWMDVYPRTGKRSGAYSQDSAYDVHPFVLMNYNENYDTVEALAHEWGHAMHSYLAAANQPYATYDYTIFVAEVASTFNEALLLDFMLKNVTDDEQRLYYLGSALESMRQTFFRQAMFAEFELAVHERVERGDTLSGETLTEIYGDILRRYHGHDDGVMTIDDAYAIEWAFIPHFYYNFYVYKYATSLAASSLFAAEVLAGKQGARDRYLSVLEAGGSEYPYELLKNAGVDLATPAPYEALVKQMNDIMDEIEAILDRSGKALAPR